MCSALQSGSMSLPGASGGKNTERPEIDIYGFEDGDIEDLKSSTPQLKKRY